MGSGDKDGEGRVFSVPKCFGSKASGNKSGWNRCRMLWEELLTAGELEISTGWMRRGWVDVIVLGDWMVKMSDEIGGTTCWRSSERCCARWV